MIDKNSLEVTYTEVRHTFPKGMKFDPFEMTQILKEKGFVFVSETCPIKFKEPFKVIDNPDGSHTFVQTKLKK